MGSAGPLEEEAEEPQTLEQQHPQRQTKQQRDTESDGCGEQRRKTMTRDEQKDVTEEIKFRMEKEREEKEKIKSF